MSYQLTNWMKKSIQALMCGMMLLSSSLPIGLPVIAADPEIGIQKNNSDPASFAMESHVGYDYAHLLADTKVVPILRDEAEIANKKSKLSLIAEPQIIFPDTSITVSWELKNAGQYKDLTTELILPKGLSVKDSLAFSPSSSKEEESTRYQVDKETTKGSIELIVEDMSLAPFFIEVQLYAEGKQIFGELLYLDQARYTLTEGKGAQVSTQDGKVTIDSPSKGLSATLAMDIREPSPSNAPGYSLSGYPIEIIAVDPNTKKNVKQFAEPITLTVTYDEKELMGMTEADLSLFYFNQETMDWWPIATTVDTKTNQLTAQVDHLTVFDYKANSWQGAALPSVDNFQVDNFTGSGTYALSFWTPPGPGGFQPALNLNYNSLIIDDSTAFTQSSWVGMGWSLDTGYIERDMHSTNTNLSDDTFLLNVAGTSSRLLPINVNGTVTTYATASQSFMTIEHDSTSNKWTVWDQSGMEYVFAHTTKTDKDSGCITNSANLDLTWRWSLTQATNSFDKTISYAYTNETKSGTCKNELAVYPTTITYPNNQYRIQFSLESRSDYQSSWSDSNSKVLFAKQRLDSIEIQKNNGSSWSNIRVYELNYNVAAADRIYPGFTWSGGGRTSTLASVQELNGDSSTALPAITFSYEDSLHLTEVQNGYGGTVSLDYERWTYLDDINDDLRSLYTEFGNHECNPTGTSWYKMSGNYGSVKCEASMLQLDRRSDPVSVALRYFPQHIVKPGGHYRLYLKVRSIAGTTDVLYGFTDPANGPDVEIFMDNVGTTLTESEASREMAANYDPVNSKLIIECDDCYVKKLQFMLMPLYYRVTQRTVTDAVTGQTSSFTYAYDEPAANDAKHSEIVADVGSPYDSLYTIVNREFRGYSMTKTVGPDNLSTTTWYYQNDALKGNPYFSLTSEEKYYHDFKSYDTNNWQYSHNTNSTYHLIPKVNGDSLLKNHNPNADWNVYANRSSYDAGPGDVVYAQFMIDDGVNTKSKLYLTTSDQSRVGLYAQPSGTGHSLSLLTKYKTGTESTSDVLFIDTVFKEDTFYTAVFFIGESSINVRVWEKGDPDNFVERTISEMDDNLSWGLAQSVYQGTVWLDTVFEGELLQDSRSTYTTVAQYDTRSGGAPDIANSYLVTNFEDLAVNWTYADTTYNRQYGVDNEWETTRVTYDYNTADQGGSQYGNLTRTTTSWWNGSSWDDFIKSKTQYYPNASVHLTHLSARQVVLDCENSTCDFTTEVGKTGETLYIYDSNTAYSSMPTAGKLMKTRAWAGGSNYAQSTIAYDSYGNVTSTTSYTSYAGAGSNPGTGSQTTTSTYDTTYYTYPLTVTNAKSQSVSTAYDYSLGVPTSITDANGNTTSAEYDDFGRMTAVAAPGDDIESSPTLQIFYVNYDDSPLVPYHVNLLQRVDADTFIRITHFYDGLGREIQTQMIGSLVVGDQKNTIMDVDYDDAGNVVKQTVPYDVTYNSTPTFVAQTFTQADTENVFDAFGRLTSSTAPNGNETEYSYDTFSTTMTDARNNDTTTEFDVWGRTTKVDEVSGPDVTYDYDVMGRLVEATRNSLVTEITYDNLGRKTDLDDPDMGE